MRSPIKSIIRNKTNAYYRNRLASNIALNLAPAGMHGDSAEFLGDVFTMIDRVSASELLMGSVLAGNVEISYVIDSVVSAAKNTDKPNYRGNADITAKISDANGYKEPVAIVEAVKAVEPVAVKEEAPVVKKAIEPTVTEVPIKPEEKEPAKAAEPEVVVEQPKLAKDSEVDDEPKAEAVEKPKRQRKIKVD